MIQRKVVLLILLVALVLAVAYGFGLVRHGFSAKDQPSSLERLLASTMRDLAILRAAKEQKNPWRNPVPPEAIFAGRVHWADHCATCHGNDRSGNPSIGQDFYLKAPDMRLAAAQNLTDRNAAFRDWPRRPGDPRFRDFARAWVTPFVQAKFLLTETPRRNQMLEC